MIGKIPKHSSFLRLLSITTNNPSASRLKVGKHSGSDNHQLPRIAAAKKKRKRKISYQSRRINRLRAA